AEERRQPVKPAGLARQLRRERRAVERQAGVEQEQRQHHRYRPAAGAEHLDGAELRRAGEQDRAGRPPDQVVERRSAGCDSDGERERQEPNEEWGHGAHPSPRGAPRLARGLGGRTASDVFDGRRGHAGIVRHGRPASLETGRRFHGVQPWIATNRTNRLRVVTAYETVAVTFRFGDVEVDPARFEVRRAGATTPVEPQVFDLLLYLITHRDRVVTKAELLDNLWGDRFVSESALTSRIKAARKAVGDDGREQRVVRTVHGRGYRFVADLAAAPVAATEATAPPPGGAPAQTVRFCRAGDGIRLAYAVSGEGAPLLKAANWLSHLDYDWESPVWHHWWEALS